MAIPSWNTLAFWLTTGDKSDPWNKCLTDGEIRELQHRTEHH